MEKDLHDINIVNNRKQFEVSANSRKEDFDRIEINTE
jgi:hypothetical protein